MTANLTVSRSISQILYPRLDLSQQHDGVLHLQGPHVPALPFTKVTMRKDIRQPARQCPGDIITPHSGPMRPLNSQSYTMLI